ncbi:hypothetical protein B5G28_10330 [Faecalibacterium sp. An77]|uniref:hypothetical protein n=1 Tax=Faecalibacterium sp. An77 TaxID=1965655 RepID=UPI000B364B4F|nr:hypothetical protein [Faecalibacterium sp. An77]OUN37692.1 hypothetical protein B5G28_10330 [Faecalibacterium sp. An77]
MKLKKIASLMLAGVMAISMLAGCSNNGSNDNKGEETVETGIVAAVNDALSKETKEIITFAADSTVDTQLKAALNAAGEKATDEQVRAKLASIIDDSKEVYAANIANVLNPTLSNDADPQEVTGVAVFKATDNLTEEASMKNLVDQISTLVDGHLKANNVTATTFVGSKATKYSYDTAAVSMVKVTALDGTTNYYAAVVITVTASVYTV